jgi:hypothetical protein
MQNITFKLPYAEKIEISTALKLNLKLKLSVNNIQSRATNVALVP